ncbi:hypothetical protein E2K98_12855 [Bacillus salipaludis]|uniref:Uncharacterized protein n=1 Tax=Bacillus salipaludis TaxID=2547811 RepID=A0A4V3ATV5_9BACI|nr:hypothetical protein [Bacillus salipaludis]TDK61773.1 hypothetical protein E2K98_12855 [Bacillus salipaludis]
MELKEKKTKSIRDIINKFSTVTNKIEIVDRNVNEIIDAFEAGYPTDESDLNLFYIHSLKLRIYVYLSRKRKATLQIEKVSSNALMVNFWFFGSIFDAQEWDQIGIKEEEFTDFSNFLEELYHVYQFKVGGIAFEEDVLNLFSCNETYPNECYRFEKVVPDHFLQKPSNFIEIIWSEKYKKLSHIPYNHIRLDKEGILIKTGSFNE